MNNLTQQDRNLLLGLKTRQNGQYSNVLFAPMLLQGRDISKKDISMIPVPELQCAGGLFACPDGSMVGRIPPLCEFVPCPTAGIAVQPVRKKKNWTWILIILAIIALVALATSGKKPVKR